MVHIFSITVLEMKKFLKYNLGTLTLNLVEKGENVQIAVNLYLHDKVRS